MLMLWRINRGVPITKPGLMKGNLGSKQKKMPDWPLPNLMMLCLTSKLTEGQLRASLNHGKARQR